MCASACVEGVVLGSYPGAQGCSDFVAADSVRGYSLYVRVYQGLMKDSLMTEDEEGVVHALLDHNTILYWYLGRDAC